MLQTGFTLPARRLTVRSDTCRYYLRRQETIPVSERHSGSTDVCTVLLSLVWLLTVVINQRFSLEQNESCFLLFKCRKLEINPPKQHLTLNAVWFTNLCASCLTLSGFKSLIFHPRSFEVSKQTSFSTDSVNLAGYCMLCFFFFFRG